MSIPLPVEELLAAGWRPVKKGVHPQDTLWVHPVHGEKYLIDAYLIMVREKEKVTA